MHATMQELMDNGLWLVIIVDIIMYTIAITSVIQEYRNSKNDKTPVTRKSLRATIIAFTVAFSFAGLYSAFLMDVNIMDSRENTSTAAIQE